MPINRRAVKQTACIQWSISQLVKQDTINVYAYTESEGTGGPCTHSHHAVYGGALCDPVTFPLFIHSFKQLFIEHYSRKGGCRRQTRPLSHSTDKNQVSK